MSHSERKPFRVETVQPPERLKVIAFIQVFDTDDIEQVTGTKVMVCQRRP